MKRDANLQKLLGFVDPILLIHLKAIVLKLVEMALWIQVRKNTVMIRIRTLMIDVIIV